MDIVAIGDLILILFYNGFCGTVFCFSIWLFYDEITIFLSPTLFLSDFIVIINNFIVA